MVRVSRLQLNRVSALVTELGLSQLISQPQSQLRVLKHMIERKIFDLVLSSVDVIIRVREGTLNNEGTGVPGLASTSVIGASISALSQDIWDIAILSDNLLNEPVKAGSTKSVMTPTLSGFPASRVFLTNPVISCCNMATTSRPSLS